jgi:ribosomal protein S18 acetylase RimI-like enzyme
VAVLSPYFPYPLSHGGAVRIFHILREASRDFDIIYFSFAERIEPADLAPILELCAKVITVPVPRYREPRWSTLVPPEVAEFRVPLMKRLLREHPAELLQVEYTQMASYSGDVLVEHDVTQDLYRQIHERQRTVSSWWNWWRWRRYENKAIAAARRVVVMSEKDRQMTASAQARVIPNGVDLIRFQPQPEGQEPRLLFVGSFRHFPNIVAYQFFTGEVWPCLRSRIPDLKFTVVAGPDPDVYWNANTPGAPYRDERIELLGFVRDVAPLYEHCTLVIVPTKVSAGTNLKVLEAMAMERAVVSTTSGCAGLGLVHGESVWIADTAEEFAAGIETLLTDYTLRRRIAAAARRHALQYFDWKQIGLVQRQLWKELLDSSGLIVRPGREEDLTDVARIQATADMASHWDPEAYLTYHLWVAEKDGEVVGFAVHRSLDEREMELLNVAVDPAHRREGVATRLIGNIDSPNLLLEVRESNLEAQNLYQKLGFVEIGRREKYYTEPDETAIVMRLSQTLKRVKV